ncbi:hypothetical protein BX616_001100, partial [Lobosporangium transversale]
SWRGPLELEIPIQVLDTPGETIHQMAAKKAIAELEQGRGWVTQAKDDKGTLIKAKFGGAVFERLVEKEAVRLGIQFQIQSEWCSFVGVENTPQSEAANNNSNRNWDIFSPPACRDIDQNLIQARGVGSGLGHFQSFGYSANGSVGLAYPRLRGGALPMAYTAPMAQAQQQAQQPQISYRGSDFVTGFGAAACQPPPPPPAPGSGMTFGSAPTTFGSFGSAPATFGSGFGSASIAFGATTSAASGVPPTTFDAAPAAFGSASTAFGASPITFGAAPTAFGSASTTFGKGFGAAKTIVTTTSFSPVAATAENHLETLLSLQTFEGSWEWKPELFSCLGLKPDDVSQNLIAKGIRDNSSSLLATFVATALSIKFFEKKLGKEKDVWDLVVQKARSWIESHIGETHTEELLNNVDELIE